MALFLASSLAAADQASEQPPRFQEYAIEKVFTGTPASPLFQRPEERRYRTAILNGVKKGYGVLEEPGGRDRPGPNFAGHYIVIQWGCGTECLQYAIVDARTGRIFQPPVPGKRNEFFDTGLLDFRLRSRLMIVKTNCAMGDSERCDRDYFVWADERFKHIYTEPRK